MHFLKQLLMLICQNHQDVIFPHLHSPISMCNSKWNIGSDMNTAALKPAPAKCAVTNNMESQGCLCWRTRQHCRHEACLTISELWMKINTQSGLVMTERCGATLLTGVHILNLMPIFFVFNIWAFKNRVIIKREKTVFLCRF